ncbi:hypothetical protein H2201_004937 [Coniosporium apollinis]|uniref:CBF1-interacting co-repressor CIR N-terminal domain-containing protein n=1 Tax=Coniosporium apollinis TaxID=61459 RepID=A0ABQ9NU90_9PEZI|nr:hypothetical protein H2201_004937 [Coniosporium apollinis]
MPILKPLHSAISALHWLNHNKVAGAIIDEMAEEIKDKEAERQKRAKAAGARASGGRRKISERPEGPSTSKKLMGRIEGYISGGPHSPPHAPAALHTEGDKAQDPQNKEGREEEGEHRERRHRHHRASGREADERKTGRSHDHHRHWQEDEDRSRRRRRHRDEQPEGGAGLTAERLALMTGGRGSPLSEPRQSRRRDMTNGLVRDESLRKEGSAENEEIGERKKQQPLEKPKFSWQKGLGAYIAAMAAWKAEQRKRTQPGSTERRRSDEPRDAERPRRHKRDDERGRRRDSSPHRPRSRKHHSHREASPAPDQRSHRRRRSGTAVPASPTESTAAQYVYAPPAAGPPRAAAPPYPEGGTSSDSDTLPHSARHTWLRTLPLPGEVRVPLEVVGDMGWRRPRDGREDRGRRDHGVRRNGTDVNDEGSTVGRVGRRAGGSGRRVVTERERRALYR